MTSAMAARVGISGDGAQASLSQELLKVKEHTKQNTTVNYGSVTPQSTYQGCTTQQRAPQKKTKVSFLVCEVTWFGRKADWDRAGDVCGFWRKSDSVNVFPAQPVSQQC